MQNNMYELALEILKKIRLNSHEAYIIGGYPRDKYLNIDTSDIDICTSATYEDLKKIFADIEQNQYGSYKLLYQNYKYEITTYRKERKYINNRFPQKILYTKKLKTDLKRRDFIINTLCITEEGEYLDILGAKNDLDKKIIRLVRGKKSLKQDALRILRAIRLATTLNFTLDKKLEQGINKYKENLKNISQDRKKQELTKILTSENVYYGISLIKKFRLEPYLNISVNNLVRTDNVNAMWAQILIDDSYNFTKKDKKEISIIKKLLQKDFELYDLYQYGPEILENINIIKKEDRLINKLYQDMPIKDRDEIDINFFEICEILEVNNNTISTIYDDIERQILYSKLKNNKNDIKKYIEKKYKKS